MRIRRRRRRRLNYKNLGIFIGVLLLLIAGIAYFICQRDIAEELTQAEKPALLQEEILHIMVMGVDRRNDDVGRSDTLMVLTVDTENARADIMSIPRDTGVAMGKYGYDKINHAFAYEGVDLSKRMTENLLGINIDHYIMVDTRAFERIIDAMDGIDIDVEKRMYYEDPWDDNGGLIIDLYPGMQHLTGERAIQYVRYRDGEGDIGRVARQQHFMRAVMEKMLTPEILPKIPGIIEEVKSAVETDMPVEEMLEMVSILPEIRKNGLTSHMLPGKPAYWQEISYWLPDIMEARRSMANKIGMELEGEFLKESERAAKAYEKSLPEDMNLMPTPVTEESPGATKAEEEEKESQGSKVQDGRIYVLVINDSGINGAAAKVAEILAQRGFYITDIDTGNRSDRGETIIVANEENVESFYGLPFKCVIQKGELEDVGRATIYIGQDFIMEDE